MSDFLAPISTAYCVGGSLPGLSGQLLLRQNLGDLQSTHRVRLQAQGSVKSILLECCSEQGSHFAALATTLRRKDKLLGLPVQQDRKRTSEVNTHAVGRE